MLRDGAYPGYLKLLQASNGKLYGMTREGGSNGAGTIFSYDPATSAYTQLKDFDDTNGANPYGSLVQASDGKLYGMTSVVEEVMIMVLFFHMILLLPLIQS